jgi:hypothetical protein
MDVYILSAAHEAIKRLTRGLVILDLREGLGLQADPWTPYADLYLVRDASARTTLVERHNCEPERIYLVPDDDTLMDLIALAARAALSPADVTLHDEAATNRPPASLIHQAVALAARLETIERQADVMLRGYQVRSRVPLFGSLIAWVRRNLTSHLREPYLDPTLERQVALNRELAAALREVLSLQADLEARLARLEERLDHDG